MQKKLGLQVIKTVTNSNIVASILTSNWHDRGGPKEGSYSHFPPQISTKFQCPSVFLLKNGFYFSDGLGNK
jgi:hypothetical protein